MMTYSDPFNMGVYRSSYSILAEKVISQTEELLVKANRTSSEVQTLRDHVNDLRNRLIGPVSDITGLLVDVDRIRNAYRALGQQMYSQGDSIPPIPNDPNMPAILTTSLTLWENHKNLNDRPSFGRYEGVPDETRISRYFNLADQLPDRRVEEQVHLDVLDIGSSWGIAAFGLKELLKIKGYTTNIIGLDPQRRVFTGPAEYGLEKLSGLDHKIIGKFPEIPLGNETADLVIFNASDYDRVTSDEMLKTLYNIVDILRPSGFAYLDPGSGYDSLERSFSVDPRSLSNKKPIGLVRRDYLLFYIEDFMRIVPIRNLKPKV